MSWTVLIVTALFAVPALVRGSPRAFPPLRGHLRHKRLPWRAAVDRGVAAGVRLLILTALTLLTVVTAVGTLAALYGHVSLPTGVVFAAIGAVLLSILTLATFGRARR